MTATPGPQQPDEVVSTDDALVFLSTLYGRGHAYPRPGQTRQEMSEESVALVRRFVADHTPAAPSAQPDEYRRLTGFDGPCTCTPWRGPGFHEVGCPRHPAQPVRDTEEGRRLCAGGVTRDYCCGLPGACGDC